jgi:hypothetical protein
MGISSLFELNGFSNKGRRAAAARNARCGRAADKNGYAAIPGHGFPFPFSKPCRAKGEQKNAANSFENCLPRSGLREFHPQKDCMGYNRYKVNRAISKNAIFVKLENPPISRLFGDDKK